MPEYVCSGAMLRCSMGMAPSSLMVLPMNRVMNNNQPQANIMDHKPMVNIMPFGMCRSLANPVVASATSAAMGTLTPMPCFPNTVAPWIGGNPKALVANQPGLDKPSKVMCAYAGVISIDNPGQVTAKEGANASFQLNVLNKSGEWSNNSQFLHTDYEFKALNAEAKAISNIDNKGMSYDFGAKVNAVEGKGSFAVGDKNNPFAKVEGTYEVLSAKAGTSGFFGSQGDKVGFALDAYASASVAEGGVEVTRTIPIPFTDWTIETKSSVSGSFKSIGGSAGAKAYYDKGVQRAYLGGSIDIEAILGVGIGFEISIGKKYQ